MSKKVLKTFGTVLATQNKAVAKQREKFKSMAPPISKGLPDNFDGREIWNKYLPHVRDQGLCGNCWAQSSTYMLSARFNIHTIGKLNVDLSPVQLTICEYKKDTQIQHLVDPKVLQKDAEDGFSSSACNGNSLYNAIDYLFRYGCPDINCVSDKKYLEQCKDSATKDCKALAHYSNIKDLPTCEELIGKDYDTCPGTTNTAMKYYRALGVCNIQPTWDQIRQEIFQWGPVAAGFTVYNDFIDSYDGTGIYSPEKSASNKIVGGHAVTIIGWGIEKGKKYWLMLNSWGPEWGDNGTFKLEAENQLLETEKNVVGAFPDIPYSNLAYAHPVQDYKWLSTASDDNVRRAWPIDIYNGYTLDTINKIKNGELIGDLRPILTSKDVPNFEKFTAGTMSDKGNYSSSFSPSKELGGNLYYYIVGIIFILLCIFVFVLYKRKKSTYYP